MVGTFDVMSQPTNDPIHDAPWPLARTRAYETGRACDPRSVPLAGALGTVLAAPIDALTDLPAFDTVSMDGWAVSGPGPWRLTQPVLAGDLPSPLRAGEAAPIATGAQFPSGATAVVRREHGETDGHSVRRTDHLPLVTGADVRTRGEEASRGEVLLAHGARVTPPVLGLAAAAGHDHLLVHEQPVVDVLIMGDELLDDGPSGDGRLRDALSPQAPGWLTSVGARLGVVRSVSDQRTAASSAIAASTADVVMTTGGTARGPVDQLHPALADVGARVVIDRVAVRPGHPMVLAVLPDGRPLLGLPGNPLAAAVAFVSLAWPLIEAARGLPLSRMEAAVLDGVIKAPDHSHRMMPVRMTDRIVQPLLHHGPAMLSGLAEANALAVAPPGGTSSGEPIDVIVLPW
jgi:molybdopterin molybdotransferase